MTWRRTWLHWLEILLGVVPITVIFVMALLPAGLLAMLGVVLSLTASKHPASAMQTLTSLGLIGVPLIMGSIGLAGLWIGALCEPTWLNTPKRRWSVVGAIGCGVLVALFELQAIIRANPAWGRKPNDWYWIFLLTGPVMVGSRYTWVVIRSLKPGART